MTAVYQSIFRCVYRASPITPTQKDISQSPKKKSQQHLGTRFNIGTKFNRGTGIVEPVANSENRSKSLTDSSDTVNPALIRCLFEF